MTPPAPSTALEDEPGDGPRLAGHIVVSHDLTAGSFALHVDGELFPWYVSEAGASTEVTPGCSPGVTVTIPAATVTVFDTVGSPGEHVA